jgi:Undecaprenyl-phosphate galactose phosphotransferase WbaP
MSVILFETDLLCVAAAIQIASQIDRLPWLAHNFSTGHTFLETFLVYGVTMLVLFFLKGLYPATGMHYVDEMRNVVTSSFMAQAAAICLSFVFQSASVGLTLILIVAGLLDSFFILAGRYFIRRSMIHLNLWGEPVAIIGESNKARKLKDYFLRNLQFGIRPVAAIGGSMGPGPVFACPALPICETRVIAGKLSLTTALVVVNDLNDIDRLVRRYQFVFRRVILIRDQTGGHSLTTLKPLDFMDLLGLQVKNDLLSISAQITKRIVDVIASSLGILFLSPLLIPLAILIQLDSHGSSFYRQPRLGRNGEVFSLLKFRTMYENADQVFEETLANNPQMKEEWDHFQKLKDDPRITRVGRFLRKFSLDEFPQLWNVWKGEMSLIGPRPILIDQRKLYGTPIKLYIQVAPGMTGFWQISGRNGTTFHQRAALDTEYIQRWSLWLDIFILFKTIKIVLERNGAF